MARTLRFSIIALLPLIALPSVAQLHATPLEDGTGTVGLPGGWTIRGSYHGQVLANDPANDAINLGMAWTVQNPRSSISRIPAPYRIASAMPGDVIGALRSILVQNGNARLLSARAKRAQGVDGAPAAMIIYEYEAGGQTFAAIGYFAALVYPGAPTWQLYASSVTARKDRFTGQLPTLMAIWRSWRPNGQKPTEGSASAVIDEIIAHRKASFEEIEQKFHEQF